jgi:hypothetical protein
MPPEQDAREILRLALRHEQSLAASLDSAFAQENWGFLAQQCVENLRNSSIRFKGVDCNRRPAVGAATQVDPWPNVATIVLQRTAECVAEEKALPSSSRLAWSGALPQ